MDSVRAIVDACAACREEMAPRRRFERPTFPLGGGCSIQLSYRGLGDPSIECATRHSESCWSISAQS